MFRIITAVSLSILSLSAFSEHSVQAPPSTQLAQAEFPQAINQNIVFTEAEFNELFIASLKEDERGRLLLSVSEGLNVVLNEDEVEISAEINLDKVEQVDPQARQIIENINSIFPFFDGATMSVTVYGEPVARNGQLGIKDNFSAKIGFIPLPNSALQQIGIDVARANTENLSLEGMALNSVNLTEGQIGFGITPQL